MADDGKPKGANLIGYQFKPGKSGFEGRTHQYAQQRKMVMELHPLAVEALREALLYGTRKEKIVTSKVVFEFGIGKPAQETTQVDQEKPKGVSMIVNGIKWEIPPLDPEDDGIIDADIEEVKKDV